MNINGLDTEYSKINDDCIKLLLCGKPNKNSKSGKCKLKRNQINYCIEHNNDIYKYLLNRYTDSLSIDETIKRIFYNINIHPKCPICGKPVMFFGKEQKFWSKTCSNECGRKLQVIKMKETCNKLYGVDNCFQSKEKKEKIKQTLINKYGVDNPQKSNIIKQKTINTCIKKYGVTNAGGSSTSIVKIKNTKLQKYGNANYNNIEKNKQTCISKYGVDCFFKSEIQKQKSRQTCLTKYGTEYYLQSKEYKDKYNTEYYNKIVNTKKKNKTYTSSKSETYIYNLFTHYFNKIICQYYSEKYPYMCDFYIPEIDTYIEYQGYYTHGNHPFDENNINDVKELNLLKEKNYYHNNINNNLYYAKITTWTITDPQKRKTAMNNNLNYIEFWSYDEVLNWLAKYEKKY